MLSKQPIKISKICKREKIEPSKNNCLVNKCSLSFWLWQVFTWMMIIFIFLIKSIQVFLQIINKIGCLWYVLPTFTATSAICMSRTESELVYFAVFAFWIEDTDYTQKEDLFFSFSEKVIRNIIILLQSLNGILAVRRSSCMQKYSILSPYCFPAPAVWLSLGILRMSAN